MHNSTIATIDTWKENNWNNVVVLISKLNKHIDDKVINIKCEDYKNGDYCPPNKNEISIILVYDNFQITIHSYGYHWTNIELYAQKLSKEEFDTLYDNIKQIIDSITYDKYIDIK